MATKPASLEIIPTGELVGIERILGDCKNDSAILVTLEEKANAIVVKDKESFLDAGSLQVQIEGIAKSVKGRLAPLFNITNTALNFLRNEQRKHESEVSRIAGIVSSKRNEYARIEREAAQREQDEINEKARQEARRKREAAPAPITVIPDVPATAGRRRTTSYPMTVVDADKFLRAWVKADGTEKKRLRKFITLDVQSLAAEAREMKDPAEFMKLYPGTECREEKGV